MVSKLGFTAEYIDHLSPADRGVYIDYYKEEEAAKQKQSQTPPGPTIGNPIDTMGSDT